jgi:hypothetical protein
MAGPFELVYVVPQLAWHHISKDHLPTPWAAASPWADDQPGKTSSQPKRTRGQPQRTHGQPSTGLVASPPTGLLAQWTTG